MKSRFRRYRNGLGPHVQRDEHVCRVVIESTGADEVVAAIVVPTFCERLPGTGSA
jgi:hypothetical protein